MASLPFVAHQGGVGARLYLACAMHPNMANTDTKSENLYQIKKMIHKNPHTLSLSKGLNVR
jgi:hypothetical protein